MVLVHIEIPFGSSVKYEFEDNKLMVDRILSTSMYYPGNYGYIPKTMGGDGDPVDVLVINSQPLIPNCYIKCKVLGMLVTEDEKGMDEKIIAIPDEKIDRTLSNLNDISDLSQEQLDVIKNFFENYKANEPNKWVKVSDFKDYKTAMKLIEQNTLKE